MDQEQLVDRMGAKAPLTQKSPRSTSARFGQLAQRGQPRPRLGSSRLQITIAASPASTAVTRFG